MSTRSGVLRFHRTGFVLALAALVTNLTGCVERRMTIRSNPPGALVYIDDYEIGTTPVSTDYIYYGTRKFRLVKEGYETLTVYQPMPSPWYEWLGIDFFSENVWPGKIRDERSYDFQMTPLVAVPAEQVLGRAEQLRAASRVMPAAAPPVQQPPVVVAPAQSTAPPPGIFATPPVGLPAGSFVSPAGPAPTYAPPGGAFPPPAAPYTLPPGQIFTPNSSLPPTGTVPNYGPPGGSAPGAPSGTIPPINPQPLPPDWRPLTGQAPGADVRR
jgi:hypothetical protein